MRLRNPKYGSNETRLVSFMYITALQGIVHRQPTITVMNAFRKS